MYIIVSMVFVSEPFIWTNILQPKLKLSGVVRVTNTHYIFKKTGNVINPLCYFNTISQHPWEAYNHKHCVSHLCVTQPAAVAFLLWRHVTHLSICQRHRHLLSKWLPWENDSLAWLWHDSSFALILAQLCPPVGVTTAQIQLVFTAI